jgi:hypothetical protein
MGKSRVLGLAPGDVIAVRMVVKSVFKPFISAQLPHIVCQAQGYGEVKISPEAVIEIIGHIPSPEEVAAKAVVDALILKQENEKLRLQNDELLKANTELLAQQVQAKLEGKS